MLPSRRDAWASWNYRVTRDAQRATVTYWMNRLQSLATPTPLLVTLNGRNEIDSAAVLGEFEYAHPVFDVAARVAQQQRALLQGVAGVYYAGAYWGYGFHEDGVQSALDAVRRIEAG
jgi:predicted NAD/FAD-binding protein